MKKKMKVIIIVIIIIIIALALALLIISEFKQTGLVQKSSNLRGNETKSTGQVSLIMGNAIKTTDYFKTSFVQKIFEYFFKRQPG